jgi:hypothetical protein
MIRIHEIRVKGEKGIECGKGMQNVQSLHTQECRSTDEDKYFSMISMNNVRQPGLASFVLLEDEKFCKEKRT